MISTEDILSGIPQKVLSPDVKNKPFLSNPDILKNSGSLLILDPKNSRKTHTVVILPELTALNPDLVAEQLKKDRRKRRA